MWFSHSHQAHYISYFYNYHYYYYSLTHIFTTKMWRCTADERCFNHRTFSVLQLPKHVQISTVNTPPPTKCADTKMHFRWKFHSKVNMGSTNEHRNPIKISEFYIKTREPVKGFTGRDEQRTEVEQWDL